MGRMTGALLIALVASACSNPWADLRPSEAEMNRANWLEGSSVALAPRACYRTLARVDCFAQPQAGEAARRVGWFDAPID